MENKKELEQLRDAFKLSGLMREATLIHNLMQETEILEDEISKLKGPKENSGDRLRPREDTR